MNVVVTDLQLGSINQDDYNRLLRGIGYSLSGYADVRAPKNVEV
jgi:hypothetical protein